MIKSEVEKIRIEITCDNQPALQLFLYNDGSMERHGRGAIPIKEDFVIGIIDKSVFEQLINDFDEKLFEKQGVYDHKDKSGHPINYSVIFIGQKPNVATFEFALGTETKEVHPLLPYFDGFIIKAVQLTDKWYKE